MKNPQLDWSHPAVTTHLRGDFGLRSETHRYIRYHDGTAELYDHKNDPFEWDNLIDSQRNQSLISDFESGIPKQSAAPPAAAQQQGKAKQ